MNDDFINNTKTLTFKEYIKLFKCHDNKNHTHISLNFPKQMYSLSLDDMQQFWSKYLIEVQNNSKLYIAEKPENEMPILVDVDIKMEKNIKTNYDLNKKRLLYDGKTVKTIIQICIETLQSILNLKHVDKETDIFTCVVLEKNPYEIKVNNNIFIKNGFHLHFPKIFLNKISQQVYFFPLIIQKTNKLFSYNIIDDNIIHNHWLLYGSCKSYCKPYLVTECYNKNLEKITLLEGFKDYNYKLYFNEKRVTFTTEKQIIIYLPRILSIFFYNRLQYLFSPITSVITPLFDKFKERRINRKEYSAIDIRNNLKTAAKLLEMLSISRSEEYITWLHVGFCLWNISEGDEEGLSMWLEFSEKCPEKFQEEKCISLWNQMVDNKFTIRTLMYFAKQDNPEQYNKWLSEIFTKTFDIYSDFTHSQVANMLYLEYCNEFVCTSITNKTWYQFENNIWKQVDKGITLRSRISCDDGIVIKKILNIIKKMRAEKKNNSEDDERNESNEKKIKKLEKLILKCKTTTFKNNIMTEAQEYFYDKDFLTKLDKDRNIIAFTNGVYDFNHNIFRCGQPQDYLGKYLPIKYTVYNKFHSDILNLENFFIKVFPDDDIREYFLQYISKVFIGGNEDKLVYFWLGEGNNGKTITQTLIEQMLGDFSVKLNTTLITGKKTNNGTANPELARMGGGVRWAVIEEPNPDEIIQPGIFKSLTGNDSFFARDLFEKGKETKEINPMFKLNIICNKLPNIKDADKATWNRIKVIPFESTFVSDFQNDDFEQCLKEKTFPMDSKLVSKLKNMTEPLAWYLIEYWNNSKYVDIIEPNKVRVATMKYKEENDIYKQFINLYVRNTNENTTIEFKTVFTLFKQWFLEEFHNGKVPKKSDIKYHFELYVNEFPWKCKKLLNEEQYINPMLT
jgi:P4 family phage/plasmid primase-like protien